MNALIAITPGSAWIAIYNVSSTTYNTWADFYSAFDSLRDSGQYNIEVWPNGDDGIFTPEFKLFWVPGNTFTLQRKNYVNSEFVGYVNVETGMSSFVEGIDRINLIYANGSEYHQSQIAALSIFTHAANN
jgi:hypothetical protein